MRLTAREPTETELAEAMSNEPVYKVVRVTDGKLKSLWVRGTRKHPQGEHVNKEYIQIFALTYTKGKLSSNGKYGIWCCENKDAAHIQVRANGHGSLCAIFKAYPIGSPIEIPLGWSGSGIILYPSIILGDLVEKLTGGL